MCVSACYCGTKCCLIHFNDHTLVVTHLLYFAQWYPELQHHCPDVPIILVGTKLDLRDDKEHQENRTGSSLSMEEGFKMQRKIDSIVKYMECSSLTGQGVNEVFEEAARIALKYEQRNTPQQRCVLL